MKIRSLIVFAFCFIFADHLEAQVFPTNQLIHENLSLINPSNYGYAKKSTIGLNYQKYWAGINHAPENISLLAETSLKSNKYGLGLNVSKHSINFLNRTSAGLGYRQTLKFNADNFINFGVQLGVEKNQIDFSRISAENPEELSAYSGMMNGTIGKGSVGLQYRYKEIQLGISAQLFFGNSFQFKNAELQQQLSYRKVPYYTFFYRHPLKLKNDWVYTPSLIIMSSQGLPFNIDILNTFTYASKIDFGVGYRQSMNLYAHVGIELYKQVKISYAYQRNLSKFSSIFSNTHEIGLKIYLNRPNYNEETKWVKSNGSSDILNQLDQQELRTLDLKRRIDSLERTLKFQKTQIEILKQEQIGRDEVNQHFNPSKNPQDNSVSKEYEMVATQSESDLTRLESETNNHYYIVLGAFKKSENAKELKKLLKKELNYETITQLVTLDGSKMYFVTLSADYTSVKTATNKLSAFRKTKKDEYSEYLNGEPWLLKIKK